LRPEKHAFFMEIRLLKVGTEFLIICSFWAETNIQFWLGVKSVVLQELKLTFCEFENLLSVHQFKKFGSTATLFSSSAIWFFPFGFCLAGLDSCSSTLLLLRTFSGCRVNRLPFINIFECILATNLPQKHLRIHLQARNLKVIYF